MFLNSLLVVRSLMKKDFSTPTSKTEVKRLDLAYRAEMIFQLGDKTMNGPTITVK